jgi:hypothetical protein
VVGEPLSMLAPERDRRATSRSSTAFAPAAIRCRSARPGCRRAQGRPRDRPRAVVWRGARRAPALLHRHPARRQRPAGGRAGAHPGAEQAVEDSRLKSSSSPA